MPWTHLAIVFVAVFAAALLTTLAPGGPRGARLPGRGAALRVSDLRRFRVIVRRSPDCERERDPHRLCPSLWIPSPDRFVMDVPTVCMTTLAGVFAMIAFAAPPSTLAAPPPNDARAAAEAISPPATVTGSTVESTVDPDEPFACQPLGGSMFYEFRAPSAERIVVRLRAAGDLDAVVDVFQRTRSQLQQVGCEVTDRSGDAALEFEPGKDAIYVVRVGQRQNAKPGDFRLDVFAPEPPPLGPGASLPVAGANGVLDSRSTTDPAARPDQNPGRSLPLARQPVASTRTCVSPTTSAA